MRVMFIAFILLSPITIAYCMEVYIAPILYVDETADNNLFEKNVQADLLKALRLYETGIVLRFIRVQDNRINAPVSLRDAISISQSERASYLIYGFLTEKEHAFYMEVRLLDYENRRVMSSFFSMDDLNNYDRLLNDIAVKLLRFIESNFNLEIIPERDKYTRILIPANLGYWTPITKDWADVLRGVVTLGSGFEFIPSDNLWILSGYNSYLSTGLNLCYRFGLGNPSKYESYSHNIYSSFPITFNADLTSEHKFFLGLGFVYILEIFYIEKMYMEMQKYIYNNFGINVNFGYCFKFNEKISLFFRNNFDFIFSSPALITYSPVIGINFKVYEKEKIEKW